MAVEAAHLFVSVTADVDKATRNLGKVNDSAGKTDGFLKGAAKQALGFGTAMIGLNVGAAIFGTITDGAIGMNATLETSTLQFETLMGDADKAKEHVEGLFDFAAKTPFETGPIIEASRLMETFGGSALNSKKNLTSFGDAAAATGQPINEVAFWMSRAYAAIQAGKPWGEAAQRLGEMGVVTPQVRAKLEELQDSGAKGPEVWGALTGSLDKFGGAMEKQAGTFDGMMSTLTDGVGMLLAKALYPLFEGLKGVIGWLNDLMASPGFNGALEGAMAAVGAGFQVIGSVLGTLWGFIQPIIEAWGMLFGVLASGEDVMAGLGETAGNLVEKIIAAFDGAISWVLDEGVPMLADAVSQMALKFIDWIGPAAEQLAASLPVIGEKIFTWLGQMLPVVVEKLVAFAGAFVGWVAKNVLPKLPGALATIAGAILGWLARTVPVVIGRVADMGIKFLGVVIQHLSKVPGAINRFLLQVITNVATWAASMLGKGIAAAVAFVGGIVTKIAEAPGKVMEFLGKLPGMVISWGGNLLRAAGRAARDFIGGFIQAMASLPGKIADKVRAAFRSLRIDIGPFHISASGVTIDLPNISLPSFATGAWNVPYTGPANIHQGEMIVPRDIAERLRGGRGFGSGEGAGSAGGGGTTIVVGPIYIENYVGTEDHLERLSRGIGQQVRAALPRRTATVGANS